MKKFVIFFIMMLFVCCIMGCSNTVKVSIEDYRWKMTAIQSVEENGAVIAYNPSADNTDVEYSYPNPVPLEMTCYAVNGKITITDETNDSVYYGTYKLTDNSSESAIYEIVILEEKGTAVTAMTTYHNNAECATLIISLGGYTLNFQIENNENDTEIGVIFQITEPFENAIEEQAFQNKDELLIYINNNFADCKYFYVFEDNESNPTSNMTIDTENTYSYYTNIEIPKNCWLIIYSIYKTPENTYCIEAYTPMTTNVKSCMNFAFGENWVYTITATVEPADKNNQ